jgi:hypothetical protein
MFSGLGTPQHVQHLYPFTVFWRVADQSVCSSLTTPLVEFVDAEPDPAEHYCQYSNGAQTTGDYSDQIAKRTPDLKVAFRNLLRRLSIFPRVTLAGGLVEFAPGSALALHGCPPE